MNHASDCGGQPCHDQTHIEIYTDGSCLKNPRYGGHGYGGYSGVIIRQTHEGETLKRREIWGASPDITTNIRMEMTAVAESLKALGSKTAEPITVFCDLDLIPKAMNEWLAGWKAKGWRTASKKPVENIDLWQRIEAEAEGRSVTWQWVRGHGGTAHNERADALANRGSAQAKSSLTGKAGKRLAA